MVGIAIAGAAKPMLATSTALAEINLQYLMVNNLNRRMNPFLACYEAIHVPFRVHAILRKFDS
jgi:hypothetical protein